MSDLAASGDIGAQIAAILSKRAHEDRRINSEVRRSADAMRHVAEHKEIEALHEQADSIRMAGWVEGGVGIAGGLATIGAAGIQFDAQTPAAQQTAQTVANEKKAELTGKLLGGGAQIASGVGSIWSSQIKAGEVEAKAKEASAKHEQKDAESLQKAAEDGIKDARELASKVLEFYKDWEAAKTGAASAALRR